VYARDEEQAFQKAVEDLLETMAARAGHRSIAHAADAALPK
jgi:hypothetical protein